MGTRAHETEPFHSGHFMILAFDHGTGEQLIPYTPSIPGSIGQVSYDDQAAAEEQARRLAERAPSYLTFAVVRVEQVAKVAGALPATRRATRPKRCTGAWKGFPGPPSTDRASLD